MEKADREVGLSHLARTRRVRRPELRARRDLTGCSRAWWNRRGR